MADGTDKSVSTSGSAELHNGNNGNNGYSRPPVFDGENFEYWKDKLESYFLGLDGDLWDLLMDGYKHPVNASGVKLTRQGMSDDQKKLFRDHHKCRTVLLNAISHAEYEKISNRETALFTLCLLTLPLIALTFLLSVSVACHLYFLLILVNTTFEYHQSQTAWCIASSDLLTLKCFCCVIPSSELQCF